MPAGHQGNDNWGFLSDRVDDGMEGLLAGFSDMPVGTGAVRVAPGAASRLRDDDGVASLSPGDDENDGGMAVEEDLLRWRNAVVEKEKNPSWKDHGQGPFRHRCFSVEWRSSVLVNQEDIIKNVFSVLGGEVSFVLGTDVRKSRADHMIVVRLKDQTWWRDWKSKLMFGHGEDVEGEGLFLRVRIPRAQSGEGTKLFVDEMIRKCDVYDITCSYREPELTREHGKGYLRPGRKKRKVGVEEDRDSGENDGDEDA